MARDADSNRYAACRAWLEGYFDRSAAAAWVELTSDVPVGPIRRRVRAGRERMRALLGAWLPDDLRGCRILDAGCGTGPLSIDLAGRGARVVAVDLAGRLIAVARERAPRDLAGAIEFVVGDMLDPALGAFDYAVAMDSLIHYAPADVVQVVAELAGRTRRSVLFTFVPRTPLFAFARAAARMLPAINRPPSVEPVSPTHLRALLEAEPRLSAWQTGRTALVSSGFYGSRAVELMSRRAAER